MLPWVPGVGHQDPGGQWAEQVAVVAVSAAGLVSHLEPARPGLPGGQHLLEAADLGAVDDLPLLDSPCLLFVVGLFSGLLAGLD